MLAGRPHGSTPPALQLSPTLQSAFEVHGRLKPPAAAIAASVCAPIGFCTSVPKPMTMVVRPLPFKPASSVEVPSSSRQRLCTTRVVWSCALHGVIAPCVHEQVFSTGLSVSLQLGRPSV